MAGFFDNSRLLEGKRGAMMLRQFLVAGCVLNDCRGNFSLVFLALSLNFKKPKT